MLMLLAGGTVATLLSRLYYNSGGNNKWMSTLTQSCGAPLLAIPLLLTPPAPEEERRRPEPSKLAAVYLGIGVLIGVDNLMYAYALLYLPVSTFSLVAATQLAFNAVTSRLINAQRFTPLIANSVVVLTFAAALLGVGASSDGDGLYPAHLSCVKIELCSSTIFTGDHYLAEMPCSMPVHCTLNIRGGESFADDLYGTRYCKR